MHKHARIPDPLPVPACVAGAALVAGLLIAIGPAAAQEGTALEEIVVTAQKRDQDLQDVAVSISAFPADMVERLGLARVNDVAAQVPNMSVFSVFGESQQPFLGIRGIGLNNFNDSFESPVALYVDEAYKGSLIGQTTQLFDVERIEVLKGPQGTLYGRNTTGGLLHVITRKPTDSFNADVSAEYGRHDLVNVTAAAGGPLGSRVRARVAVDHRAHDGWAEGFLDGVDYSDGDSLAGRAIVQVDLTDDAQLEISAHASSVDILSTGFGLRGYLDPVTGTRCSLARIESGVCVSPSLGGRSANDLGGLEPGATPGSGLTAARGEPPRQEVELWGVSGRLLWDFGAWQLNGVLAYDEVDKFYEEDLDADGFFFDDGLSLDADSTQLELRASGDFGAGTWLAGFFHFDDHKDTGSFLIPDFIFTTRGVVDTTSWALFGQVEYEFMPGWRVTGGIRYTEESKDLDFSRSGFINDAGTRDFSSEDVTGKASLSWNVTEDAMLYASFSTGFKTGGFNTQFVFGSLDEIDPVDNEEIAAWEAGFKSEFAGGRMQLNGAAFYYDYSDIQLTVFTLVPGAPFPSNLLRNAGSADIYGLDLEFAWLPLEHTEIRIGLGLLDHELDSDQIIDSAGVTTPADGKRLMNAPDTTLNVQFTQGVPLGASGALFFNASYAWQDKVYFSIENVDTESQDSYGLLDLGAGWRSPAERWQVEAYVDNATDEEYSVASVDFDPTFGVITWGMPRWWGVRVRYRYD